MEKIQKYSYPVVTLKPEDSAMDAIFSMKKHKIKHIVITRGEIPVGMVSERDIGRYIENDRTSRTLDELRLDEIMRKNLVTVGHDTENHFYECSLRMEYFNIGSVLVVDAGKANELVGITTKADLTRVFPFYYAGIYSIKDYMTKKAFTCRKEDYLFYVLDLLNRNDVARLVVTDNKGVPCGIITYQTLLQNCPDIENELRRGTRRYLLPTSASQRRRALDVLESDLLTVKPNDDLAVASRIMTEFNVSGTPVISDEGMLLGMVSTTDIAARYSDKVPASSHTGKAKKETIL